MKPLQNFYLGLLVTMLSVGGVRGQEIYRVNFKGEVTGVDASGNEFVRKINTKTLIQEWANRVGVTEQKDLMLAYRVNADGQGGDTIEVINKNTGATVVVIFPMSSPESAVASSDRGTTARRFLYVYDIYQPGFSMGTAVLNERESVNRKSGASRVIVSGEMQWYWLADNFDPTLRIGDGRFKVGGKPITFQTQ